MQRDPLCASVLTMQCAMGRTKTRIGRYPKNYEKHLAQKRAYTDTVYSFIEMTKQLLSVPGVEFFLSEKLCQDRLESFFGKQRAAGGRNDNPTVQQFCHNTVSLRVQGSTALEPVRGSCRKRSTCTTDIIDNTPLPNGKDGRRSKQCTIM